MAVSVPEPVVGTGAAAVVVLGVVAGCVVGGSVDGGWEPGGVVETGGAVEAGGVVDVGAVVDGDRSAVTATGNASSTRSIAASPGQAVSDMVRCPVIVGVVTSVPSGCAVDPRDSKRVVAPGAVSMSWRSASQARSWCMDDCAAGDGGSLEWSPRKAHFWSNPWLPPVASPRMPSARLPHRASQMPPKRSTTKL